MWRTVATGLTGGKPTERFVLHANSEERLRLQYPQKTNDSGVMQTQTSAPRLKTAHEHSTNQP
jgi:hypothetical protein